MKAHDATESVGRKGVVTLVSDAVGARSYVPGPVRAMLRLPLYYKLIIANAIITLAAVLTCAALVSASARAGGGASTREGVWIIIAVAAVVGVLVNSVVVHIALIPVRNLVNAAERVLSGDEAVRAEVSPLSDAATAHAVTVFNDMLDTLATYRRRMREIASRAVDAGESERSRLSRELHDGVAQALAATLIQLRVAQKTMSPESIELTTAASEQITAVINELRALAQSLRPPSLDMIGLGAAIGSYARTLGGLQVEVEVQGVDNLLSNDTKLTLYRLVQEALQNVVHHAHTKVAVVDIRRVDDEVIATVIDKGRGFDVQRAMDDGALGLFGMHERALYAGGSATVESAPGKGTVVRVSIPIGE